LGICHDISLKESGFATSKGRHFFQRNMGRPVNKLSVQPVFIPNCMLILIVNFASTVLQQGCIHITFGSGNDQFELLISAVVDVFAGIVIVNVVVDVLSDPKSKTAIDLLP